VIVEKQGATNIYMLRLGCCLSPVKISDYIPGSNCSFTGKHCKIWNHFCGWGKWRFCHRNCILLWQSSDSPVFFV